MSKSNIEQQGLLQPESFDLDDLESSGHVPNGHPQHPSEDWSRPRKTWSSSPRWLRPRWILIGVATVAALLVVGVALNKGKGFKIPKPSFSPSKPETPQVGGGSSKKESEGKVKHWEKPKDFKIIGLIFFGRPSVVAILDCYLKRNLVTNGGWLDEVRFVVNTKKEDDIAYLDELVTGESLYKKIVIENMGYNEVWEHGVDHENMFIKIDDDIVFFNDEAIPDIVFSKLKHPHSLDVVANLVNSPETGWLHYRFGAIHAYLPELEPPQNPSADSKGPIAWRASKLPEWKGDDMSFPVKGVRAGKDDDSSVLPPDAEGAAPFEGHRWLPLPGGANKDQELWRTPMKESSYDPNGPDWGSWSLGAQAHYSFLENLEKDNLKIYHYGHGVDQDREGIWNMAYARMNINFMAIWGKDVLDNLPFDSPDDEHELSVGVNQKVRRPLLVNTHAIAAHFSFRSQHEMYQTDLLDRYRAYANEMICTKDNQIKIP
ncbi:hypothetical protein ACLMJK_000514 [Lecanora helva]